MSIYKKSEETVKYIDFTISDDKIIQYSFFYSKNNQVKVYRKTHVTVRYMTTADAGTSYPPWTEKWDKSLGNIPVPPSPWLGYKITAIANSRLFIAIDNKLVELDQADGEIRNESQTGNTILCYIIPTVDEKHLFVLNNYYGFSHTYNKSNLACYDLEGDEIWRAQLPLEGDVFTGIKYENEILTGYSWNGYNHKLNPHNGAISESTFTK